MNKLLTLPHSTAVFDSDMLLLYVCFVFRSVLFSGYGFYVDFVDLMENSWIFFYRPLPFDLETVFLCIC